ncbi:MAG: hypothetical protein K6B14_02010 [Lachnospiraceae bacterium]|nr:hypothetical protein [Lachnospiraceae bacterium]
MKNVLKKIALLMLAVSMTVPAASALGIPAASVAEAASTEKITLYVGEKFAVSGVKSIKSGNSKVVKAGTDKSSGYVTRYMIAKKAGTATVTTKSSYGNYTTKYKVTVKKNPCTATIKWSAYKMSDTSKYGEAFITIKNSSSQIFDDVEVRYTLKKADGSVIEEDTKSAYSGIAGKGKAYIILSGVDKTEVADMSVKVTGLTHYPNYNYKDVTSKVKVETSEEAADKEIKVQLTAKNTTKSSVSGSAYFVLKDGSGEVIGVKSASTFYLKSKATDTSVEKTLDIAYYPGYDHYEVENYFYTKKIK